MIHLNPILDPEPYVYCRLPLGSKLPFRPRMVFEEDDSLTVVLSAYQADSLGYESAFPCRRITLAIASSLTDVGLTARVAKALAAADIPCNVVAALGHDHLFVPDEDADAAHKLLQTLK